MMMVMSWKKPGKQLKRLRAYRKLGSVDLRSEGGTRRRGKPGPCLGLVIKMIDLDPPAEDRVLVPVKVEMIEERTGMQGIKGEVDMADTEEDGVEVKVPTEDMEGVVEIMEAVSGRGQDQWETRWVSNMEPILAQRLWLP